MIKSAFLEFYNGIVKCLGERVYDILCMDAHWQETMQRLQTPYPTISY